MDIAKAIQTEVENSLKAELGRFNENLLSIAKAFKSSSEELELYTVKEVAKILKSSEATVYKLIEKDYLKSIKLGHTKIIKSDLVDFVEKLKVEEIEI